MDLKSIKSVFTRKSKENAKNGGKGGQGGKNARGAKKDGPSRGGSGGKNQKGRPGEKIAPVSPSRARLAKRSNDEKIIKIIKIIFTTLVSVAVVSIVVAIFLYAYKPSVATVGGEGISQYEFKYYLSMAAGYASEYSTVESIGKQAIDAAAESKVMHIVAKGRGLALTQEDNETIKSQLDYIDQMASSDTEHRHADGDDYLRAHAGVDKAQYKKIMEQEILRGKLYDLEYEAITVPDEDALIQYENNIAAYSEVTVRHILFLYEGKEGGPGRTPEESEELAYETAARIKAGADMADLVQELSEDGNLSNEGIYTFTADEGYEQAFKDWAFDPDREINETGVCETSYGYHVMRLEDRRLQTFEEVREEIIYEIKQAQVESIFKSWVEDPKYTVQINQRVFDSVVAEVLG